MLKFKIVKFLVCLSVLRFGSCARILAMIPTASISHQVVFHPLWKELSLRGHEVVVLTTDPVNNKSLTNLTEIDLHFSYTYNDKHEFTDKINRLHDKPLQMLNAIITVGADICDQQLKHKDVQTLIHNETEHFDIVFAEVLQPCSFAFKHRFQAPVIGVVSMDAPLAVYDAMGNPTHPITSPDFILPVAGQLTFMEKLSSVIFSVVVRIYSLFVIVPLHNDVIQRHFGDYPTCLDLLYGTDMMFVNVHPLLHGIRPNVPSVVNIGVGMHIQPKKPLPKELQSFLDQSKKGVIYFSLGSNVKSKDINEATRKVIIETFAELPYDILWKFEADNMAGKPDNVKIMKWVPQQDILRHPNIKVFITQGGLQSTEEAIFTNVPMVGMPFFGDQVGNVKKMVLRGLGLSVEHKDLTKETFKKTILEVIENPKYRNKVKELAVLLQDEPMTGLEKAVWWTEHVIRHKGAKHYRSPAVDMPIYEYFMLDVIGFLLLVLIIACYVLAKVTKMIVRIACKLLCGSSKQKLKKQ